MNKDFLTDYFGFILLKSLGPLLRLLPLGLVLFFGQALGRMFYYCDSKHRAIVYSNLKTAFRDKSHLELLKITKDFYLSFGQNIIEIFIMPRVDAKYVAKYITIDSRDNITKAFSKGKGVIFLSMHSGSWELTGLIAIYTGCPFNLFVAQQRLPRMNNLLNKYRLQKGCKLIHREHQMRRLIELLRANEAVAMTIDQGGSGGELVEFFGKTASMSIGALKLALKYDCAILPVYYTRISGPYSKVIIGKPVELQKSGDAQKDVQDSLKALMPYFEENISKYPKDYLWTYKVWKYSDQRNVLILSDGKAGHLRQSERAAKILEGCLKARGIRASFETIEESRLKNYQGPNPDFVISCGSSVAAANLKISKESRAKSIIIMRPPFFSAGKFDLIIMSQHDRPPKAKNIVEIEGALNLIDDGYLKEQVDKFTDRRLQTTDRRLQTTDRRPQTVDHRPQTVDLKIGLLIGGDTKNFFLKAEIIKEVLKQVKAAAEKLDASILITTSRRTSKEVEDVIKDEFKDYPRLELLVIANKNNIPETVGAILGLSQIIVTSPESISMISEGVSSAKFVFVFDTAGVSAKHGRFLDLFAKNKYIYKVAPNGLSEKLESIWQAKPEIKKPKDNFLVTERMRLLI
ncbi:MAG: ELM1/GtrOC1 family putative glycosyltransferase [Candidatus Omnitrophota bacterium]